MGTCAFHAVCCIIMLSMGECHVYRDARFELQSLHAVAFWLQLMEAANASDEEKDGINSFDTRALKRPRCYPSGPPRMAKAGILV